MQRLRNIFRRFRRDEDGVMAVEFALTFPIYIGAVMFLVEAARVVYMQSVVMFAAEEATRFALVNYEATAEDIEDKARENLLGLDAEHLTAILVTDPVDPDDQTKLVTIQIQYQYEPLVPLIEILTGGTTTGFALSGESRGFLTEEIPETF